MWRSCWYVYVAWSKKFLSNLSRGLKKVREQILQGQEGEHCRQREEQGRKPRDRSAWSCPGTPRRLKWWLRQWAKSSEALSAHRQCGRTGEDFADPRKGRGFHAKLGNHWGEELRDLTSIILKGYFWPQNWTWSPEWEGKNQMGGHLLSSKWKVMVTLTRIKLVQMVRSCYNIGYSFVVRAERICSRYGCMM